MSRCGALRLSRDDLLDLMGWLVAGVVVGGRAGWWLFYHRVEGVEPWYEPIAIWHGGMSFHGGLIGVAVVFFLWSWHPRVSFWDLTDALALGAPIGVFLRRLAPFINTVLAGRPTSLPL